jgi:HEAT repeat protein
MKKPRSEFVGSVAPAIACFVVAMAACSSETQQEPQAAAAAAAPTLAGPPSFPALFAELLSRQAGTRREAIEAFREHWHPARDFVTGQTQAADASRRTAATWLLAQLGAAEDLPQLRSLLHDETESVRLMALQGIDRLHDATSAPILAERAENASFDEACQLLATLARLKPAAAEAACARLVTSEDWARRRAAARTLGELESASSALPLLARLQDRMWLVQAEAAKAAGLRRLMAAHPRLLELMKAEQYQLRAAATTALGYLRQPGDLAGVEALARADRDAEVRIAAIEALAGFPEATILPALTAKLGAADEEDEVREAALRTLAGLESTEAKARLSTILEQGDARLRKLAERVLPNEGKPGDAAAPPR